VRIEHVPLSANGKFDRDALPPPAQAIPLGRVGFRAPQTPAQVRLAAILGDLLGDVPVGADDNFFLLGGHSLLGTQVVLRAQEAFGVQLSLRDLFRAPTVAELADRVTELLAATLESMTDEEAELWAAN
jgi:acyl carrier protein